MLPEIPPEELGASLDAVAAGVLEAVGIDAPPVDLISAARQLGITVAWDDRQRVRGRYVRLGSPRGAAPTIFLRPEPRPERRQWAVAHEIGEHTAHRVFAELWVDPREVGPEAREDVANHLASRLLLPTSWFTVDGSEWGWDLTLLKTRYSTASHELIARRMLDMAPAVIITIFDHGQVTFRRSNVSGQVPPPSPTETGCWQAVHDENRPECLSRSRLSVQGWPVHEPGWKREILRTEVEFAEIP
jgi:hypothetical protein